MIETHPLTIAILIIVIALQQIQLLIVNKKISTLFKAYEMMCEVNQKEFEAIKSIMSFVQERNAATDKIFTAILQNSEKHRTKSNDETLSET